MKIDVNVWLSLIQIGFIMWALVDHIKFRRWIARCQYWRRLIVRELEFMENARNREDHKAAATHEQAFQEYFESFKKEITK